MSLQLRGYDNICLLNANDADVFDFIQVNRLTSLLTEELLIVWRLYPFHQKKSSCFLSLTKWPFSFQHTKYLHRFFGHIYKNELVQSHPKQQSTFTRKVRSWPIARNYPQCVLRRCSTSTLSSCHPSSSPSSISSLQQNDRPGA